MLAGRGGSGGAARLAVEAISAFILDSLEAKVVGGDADSWAASASTVTEAGGDSSDLAAAAARSRLRAARARMVAAALRSRVPPLRAGSCGAVES